MLGKQQSNSYQNNLEAIIDEEIFGEEKKNVFKRAKQGVEKLIFKGKNKIIIPLSAAVGGTAAYVSYPLISNLADVIRVINPSANLEGVTLQMAGWFGLAAGGSAYILLDDKAKEYIGKKVCDIRNSGDKVKKRKDSFIYRNKGWLALGTWAPTTAYLYLKVSEKINSLPLATKQLVSENTDKWVAGTAAMALGYLGTLYMLFHTVGRGTILQKGITWREMAGILLYKLSKKEGITYLENESRKGNIYADNFLSGVKENIDEKLDYKKKVIEHMREEEVIFTENTDTVRNTFVGRTYLSFQKYRTPSSLVSLAISIYPANPSRAVELLNRLSNTELDLKPQVLATRNYLLNIYEKDRTENWQELRSWLEKFDKLQLIEGSEGMASLFFDDFTNKNFIFKDYKENKSDKFFIERAIHNTLKDSEISVENPLFYYDEGNEHKQVFIRNGEQNLREILENKSISQRKECFERVLPLLLLYQQKVFSALERNGSEFVMNIGFRGEKRSISIPVLNLEKNLMRRAFLGSKPGEIRLGENEYLPSLLLKIQEYNQLNQYEPVFIFNHGDAVTANITETLCIIDPRPRIAHPLYDLAYVSCDPAFLSLSFDSRKEKVLETCIKNVGFLGTEADFIRAFDPLYLNVALCNAGANLYLGKQEYAKMLVNDLLEFSKGKPFEKEIMTYLKHSNASS
ncbi:MAG TPA: hypothetical protein VJ461_04065 [Candidatus Nanoarchaeia archaeon]|nr:hypothetical protein [Candidatus Nanoarchaeia archaeon]